MVNKGADHLDLLVNISELADLVIASSDLENFFQHSVDLLARHFRAPVCSIYLYNEKLKTLILTATKGLKPEAVDRITMKPGEGLVGQSFETLSIIREGNASQNPKFKYFSAAGEDPFNSFLCGPIRRGIEKIGVLVVQHRDLDYFDASDERVIRAVVGQFSGLIENARLLMELARTRENTDLPEPLSFVKGTPAIGGLALGTAVVASARGISVLHAPLPGQDTFTKTDFLTAVEKTTLELQDLQKKFAEQLPESAALIFTAHFMILKDKNFTGKMGDLMDAGTAPVEAVRSVAARYIDIFSSSPHAYMREKAQDVEDLSVRILNNLGAGDPQSRYEKGSIAIARQIYPSDILKFVSAGIKGIILAGGGLTSHVTILARSLQIPLIIAEEPGLLTLPENTRILMDGEQGNVYINPDKETLALFEKRVALEQDAGFVPLNEQTRTLDNEQVTLLANINLLSEVPLARRLNAQGIGLYRTEFPFLIRAAFPSEAEQYLIYKRLLAGMENCPVTIRTLDAGGEKAMSYTESPREANPELGLRSIRFSLRYKDIFESQIRAILRAAAGKKKIRIMFPLISSIDEFLEAKQIIFDCMDTLSSEQIAFNRDVAIGMMIELPAVLETIDEFARLADFFSIGTNDFIQYMLAADRANKMVADYYLPYHPAVSRGIAKIVTAANTHGIDVSVCGEMAHEREHIPFLLGVGVRTLSVDPQFLPMVQDVILNLTMADAREHAHKLLAQSSVRGARTILDAWKTA